MENAPVLGVSADAAVQDAVVASAASIVVGLGQVIGEEGVLLVPRGERGDGVHRSGRCQRIVDGDICQGDVAGIGDGDVVVDVVRGGIDDLFRIAGDVERL